MAKTSERTASPAYNSMEEIQARKMQLLKEIHQDSLQIERLRHELFKKDTTPRRKGILGMKAVIGTGAGILDGMLMAWKLYRRFKK